MSLFKKGNRCPQFGRKKLVSSNQLLLEVSLIDNKQKKRVLFRAQYDKCIPQEFHLALGTFYAHVYTRTLKKEGRGSRDVHRTHGEDAALSELY